MAEMSVDQIIALSSCIGTFLAAGATFWTVREMKRQKEAAYQPQIVLPHLFFECKSDPATEGVLPEFWQKKEINIPKSNELPKTQEWFCMPVYNIGTGAAKDVTVTWSFPIEDLVNRINPIVQKRSAQFSYDCKEGSLTFRSSTEQNHTIFWKNERKNSLDYILPTSIEENPRALRLPLSYIYLISAFIFAAMRDEKHQEVFQKLPSIQITFEYTDIGESKHLASYSIVLDLEAASKDFFVGRLKADKTNVPIKRKWLQFRN